MSLTQRKKQRTWTKRWRVFEARNQGQKYYKDMYRDMSRQRDGDLRKQYYYK